MILLNIDKVLILIQLLRLDNMLIAEILCGAGPRTWYFSAVIEENVLISFCVSIIDVMIAWN